MLETKYNGAGAAQEAAAGFEDQRGVAELGIRGRRARRTGGDA